MLHGVVRRRATRTSHVIPDRELAIRTARVPCKKRFLIIDAGYRITRPASRFSASCRPPDRCARDACRLLSRVTLDVITRAVAAAATANLPSVNSFRFRLACSASGSERLTFFVLDPILLTMKFTRMSPSCHCHCHCRTDGTSMHAAALRRENPVEECRTHGASSRICFL